MFNRYSLKKAAGWLVLLLFMMVFMQTEAVFGQGFTVAEGGTHNGAVANGDAPFTLTLGPSYGTLTFNSDGTFTYAAHRQPTAGFVDSDSFQYKSADQGESDEPNTVSISITAVNDSPIAISHSFTVNLGETHNGQAGATDVDGDALNYVLNTGPANGTLIFNADGSFTYTANSYGDGTDSFTFNANDGLADSAPATVNITIVKKEFCGGEGTEVDPYLICTADELNNVRLHLDAYFKLNNDIDLDVAPYNEGEGWEPIGEFTGSFRDDDNAFKGHLDGAGFIISNLYINRPEEDLVGLFGFGKPLNLINIGIKDLDITGGNYVGAVVGQNGIGGTIENSYSTGKVSGTNNVGGLAGSHNGIILNSYSNVNVIGNYTVGGLLGMNANTGVVTNSFSTGEVTAVSELTVVHVGGLVGQNTDTVTNSFYDSQTSGQNDTGKGMPKTTAEMKELATFTTAGATWDMVLADTELNDGYPFLAWQDDSEEAVWLLTESEPLFCGGEGTEADPYLICTADQLNNIREDLTAHYKLANDINLDVAPYNEGEGWEPIGSDSTPFSGYFDGDDNSISGLTINRGSQDYIGLFGYISLDSEIKNIGLEDVSIAGDDIVGALAGSNEGNISNAYSTGVFTSTYSEAGGLVGHNRGIITDSYSEISISVHSGGEGGGLVGFNYGTIEDSHATGAITGYEYLGGLVGKNQDSGIINNCYASGNVTSSEDYSGGLAGENNGTISNSYSTGSVSGDDTIGGFVGSNWGNIQNSYAKGDVTGSSSYVGGFVGYHNRDVISDSYSIGSVTGEGADVGGFAGSSSGGTITDSYYNSETSGQNDTGKGEPKTTAELQTLSTFSEWNIAFSDTELNDGYPFLGWQDENDEATWLLFGEPPLFCGGDGTEADPYLICDADQLNNIREDLTAHYKLANDIDLDVAPYNVGEGWEPIANYEHFNDDSNVPFAGKFDGNGKTISGLFINRPEEYGVGLFCWAEDFEISNLTLMDVNVTGLSRVGALVGDTTPSTPGTDGKIENVFVSGNIKGLQGAVGGLAGRTRNMSLSNAQTEVNVEGALDTGGSDIGGLVGNAQTDTFISHSSSSGTVFSMNNRVGGLTGMLWSSTIENSYSTVQVEGKREVGGLSGEMGRSTITGSYATGNVTAYTDGFEYGGLVGKVRSESTIKESYATGDVNGKLRLAGLVGDLRDDSMIEDCYAAGIINGEEETGGLVARKSSGTITNSFYDAQTSGQSDTGKGTPKTTAEMKQQGTFTDAGWDFANLWAIESGVYISYPYFGNSDEAPEQDPPPGYVKVSGFDEAPRLFVTAGKTTTVTVQHILFGEDESVTITQIPGHGGYALFLDDTAVDNNDVIQKSDVESGKLVYETENGVQPATFIYDYDRFTYENSEQQRTLPIDLAAQTMPYEFSEGWFLFSSPGDGQTVGEMLGNIRTEGYPGSTNPGASFPTVYTLDQENYQWAAVTGDDQVLVQGTGLLVYVFEEDTPAEELLFSAGPWAPLDGSFTYDDLLWYDPGQGTQGNSHFLIGNPHPVGINICDMLREGTNMATSIDIWVPMENDGHGGYVNFSCDVPAKAIPSYTQSEAQSEEIRFEGILPPFIGFWVRTTGENPSLAITESDYVSMSGKQREMNTEPVTLVLSHEDRNYSNTVNILFSDRGSEVLDRIDAIKLSSAGLAQRYLSFYAMDSKGRNYALRSLPALAGDEVTIPLGIETTEEGSYSLTWSLPEGDNSGASYYLRDLSNGTKTQLNDGQSYSFELEAAAVSKATDSPLTEVFKAQSTAKEGAPRFELIVTTRELADNGTELPSEIVLRQNYPNPFNPSTVIQYELPQASAVRLAVFDMAGRQVAELVNGQVAAGSHSITFEAGSLSSGVYMYRLQAGGTLLTRKLTIIK